MAIDRKLILTLVGSPIGQTERQRRTLRGLGLTRVGRKVELSETSAVRGMISKVQHLIREEK